MDNQTIEVVSEGTAGILHALEIIWSAAVPGGMATHYDVLKLREEVKYYCRDKDGGHHTHHFADLVEDNEKGVQTLVLLWHEERSSKPLPYPLTKEQAAEFIVGWLATADFGRQPDHDGDNGKGWRIFTEGWGHVAGRHYAIVGVQPAWSMYGK